MRRLLTFFLLLIVCVMAQQDALAARSETVRPSIVSATLISALESIDAKTLEIPLALQLEAPDDWHTYWQNPGESGMATEISAPEGAAYTLSALRWPLPHRLLTADITSYGYAGTTTLPFTATLEHPSTSALTLTVKASWLACKDTCIPEQATLTLTLPLSNSAQPSDKDKKAMDEATSQTPAALTQPAQLVVRDGGYQLVLARAALPAGELDLVDAFVLTENTASVHKPTALDVDAHQVRLSLDAGAKKDATALSVVLSTLLDGKPRAFTVEARTDVAAPTASTPAATSTDPHSENPFFSALLLAFFGGLVLNVMPCVLPVLSLKLLALSRKASASRREALRHAVAYTVGILCCFFVLGVLLLGFQQAGHAVGWGFQLQSPYFVTALAIVMLLVGLNLVGAFHIPDILGSWGQDLSAQDNTLGSFATGGLAAVAATPCTAPFMAPAIGVALSLPAVQAMLVFLGLGLGMAAPFLLISLVPALQRRIPKPGAWMVTFRQLLAFPMFATVAWLLWVMVRSACAYALAPAMAILVMTAFAVWVMGHLRRKLIKLPLLLLTLAGIVYATQQIGALPAISGDASLHGEESFSEERLKELRAQNIPVLVNATADWCLTCKVNEASTLERTEMKDFFKEQGIVVLTADWTRKDDSITKYLRSMQRQGVPLYAFYSPHNDNPIILPQILSIDTVKRLTCHKQCSVTP